MRGLRLAPHVRACYSNAQVVLLDLQRDKYLAIGGAPAHAAASIVEGWPVDPPDAALALADTSTLKKRLLDNGLVTAETCISEHLPAATVPEAVTSLGEAAAASDTKIGTGRLVRFMYSVAAGAAALRCRSLLAVARSVAQRRTRLEPKFGPLSLDAAQEAVTSFQRLRPLLFTAYDKCLFDSLALINFLASEGMFPRWVIGVNTHPFAAHAWVQSEGTVLNDLHERVRRYTPILVV